MKKIYKISFIKLVLGLIALNCYGQSYLITNEKQIKPSVKNDIVNTSSVFQDMKTKVNLLNSATTQLRNDLNSATTQLRIDLNNEINNRQNIDNQLISSMTTMYNDFREAILELEQNTSTTTLSNTFALKAGDTFTGNVNVNGNLQVGGIFGVGSQGVWSGGNIYSLGSIEAVNGFTSANQIPFKIMDKTSYLDYNKLFINGNIDITGQYLINGVPISSGGSGDNLGNHIATTTLNMNGNKIENVNIIHNAFGTTPIGLAVGDLTNEYYDSVSTGSYLGLRDNLIELASVRTDNENGSTGGIFKIDNINNKMEFFSGGYEFNSFLNNNRINFMYLDTQNSTLNFNGGYNYDSYDLVLKYQNFHNVQFLNTGEFYYNTARDDIRTDFVLSDYGLGYSNFNTSGDYNSEINLVLTQSHPIQILNVNDTYDTNSYLLGFELNDRNYSDSALERFYEVDYISMHDDFRIYKKSNNEYKFDLSISGNGSGQLIFDTNLNDFYFNKNAIINGGLSIHGNYLSGNGGNTLEVINFNSINVRNNFIVGDGNNDYQVYVCNGGTMNGVLTITDTQCTSAGGTAEGTKLFIKK